MNRKYCFLTAFLALPLVVVSTARKTSVNLKAAGGIYEQSSLPTTICLDDYSDNDIRNYYSNLNSKSDSERQGDNLLKNLKPILSNNQKYYSYDKGSGKTNLIWKIYEIADRDWKESPKESISTYDATSNTITNYEFGKENPYVRALYVDRSIDNPKTAWENHSTRSSSACIEREHIWPKSHGFDAEEGGDNAGARGDPMHLWAADGGTNGIHSNYFYGNVDTSREYKTSKENYSWTGDNLLGFSKTISGSNSKVFEPQDSDKGDIARACFYMVARYNNIANNDNNINSANPNLCLSNDVSKSEETGTSTSSISYSIGIMADLLEWNKLDPVDEFELHRNNLLYGNFTNNRNPFIDFPEWADLIWGNEKNTKSANPSLDEIARPKDFVPPTEDKNESEFELPKTLIYGALIVVVIIIIVVVFVVLKGTKQQKKALKKTAKKILKGTIKTTSSSKKKK